MRFNPRSPCGGSDLAAHHAPDKALVSTPAPLAGSDLSMSPCSPASLWFQPTLPLRGATGVVDAPVLGPAVSAHAPLAGSDDAHRSYRRRHVVSTHAPPCGERPRMSRIFSSIHPFQPTLPLRGATSSSSMVTMHCWFQPTLPLRGATLSLPPHVALHRVSTHAPLAGSDGRLRQARRHGLRVSTHAPLAGSDIRCLVEIETNHRFQPTLPLRGATERRVGGVRHELVSTHAPLAGSDNL